MSVTYELEGPVAVVTIARPEVRRRRTADGGGTLRRGLGAPRGGGYVNTR